MSLRDLASEAECSASAVMYLENGWFGEHRYLGLRGSRNEAPVIIRVAQALDLDRQDVADALLTDLGWPKKEER